MQNLSRWFLFEESWQLRVGYLIYIGYLCNICANAIVAPRLIQVLQGVAENPPEEAGFIAGNHTKSLQPVSSGSFKMVDAFCIFPYIWENGEFIASGMNADSVAKPSCCLQMYLQCFVEFNSRT